MQITFDVTPRLYNNFMQWCYANSMSDDDISGYIEKALSDRFYTDKYGDLNDKLKKKEETVTPTNKEEDKLVVVEEKIENNTEETVPIEKKSRTRTIKSR